MYKCRIRFERAKKIIRFYTHKSGCINEVKKLHYKKEEKIKITEETK